jgi:uncharacterized protein YdgA (DUF945 family)
MLEKLKNGLGKPAGWMYFILVVALLIIVSRNGDKVDNLQAELDSANADISTLETLYHTTQEAMSNEIAVRDDAIAGLESESVAINARLNDVDSLRGDLELENVELGLTVADLQAQLDLAIANPVCPACLECPAVTE